MRRQRLIFPLVLIAVSIGAFLMGPKKDFPNLSPTLPHVEVELEALESWLADREGEVQGLKPNNQARIVWADSVRQTPHSIVFLHGFSASPMECDPIHLAYAKKYGCNLYLARITGHGIDSEDALLDLTPQQMLESAQEAIAIGQKIGKQVIVMSSSTGGTLSIYLAAQFPESIHAQILLSPNIALYSSAASILTQPWGFQIGRLVEGERRYLDHLKGEKRNYWSTTYRLEGVVALLDLMEQTMKPEVFQQVKTPLFVGYYYKNEDEQDHVVSVPAILDFYEQVGTPHPQKQIQAFPNAGHHVICSRFQSKDFNGVLSAIEQFSENILDLKPVLQTN